MIQDWTGVTADSPDFGDRIDRALRELERNERLAASRPSAEQSIRFAILLAFERASHARGFCTRRGWLA